MAERPDPEERHGWRAAAFWTALALALRLPLLGRFSLWGDEVYSLDAARTLFTPAMGPEDLAFPLFPLLERAVLELLGLARTDDPSRLTWALRIVPALAGALAAGAAFRSSRGFLARRERHVLAALVAFSPWLLFYSQMARFYTLLLALATPAAFELMRATRDASWRRGAAASAWLLAATLAHPTALLLLAGHAAAALAAALLRARRLNAGLVPPLCLPLLLALPAAIWPEAIYKTVLYKLDTRDAGVESVPALLLGIGYSVGPVVAAIAVLGLPSLWRRDRLLAIHCIVGVAAPVATIVALAALGRSVEQRYLLAVLPLALLPAATFLVELGEALAARLRGARLLVPALALLPWGPGVASEYLDGDRHDLAGAARLLEERMGPQDGVVAETHSLVRRYLRDLPEERLVEAPPDRAENRRQFLAMWERCPRLWIVIPAQFEWMGSGSPERSFQEWAWHEGRLVRELWVPRLDYHQNSLRVYVVETASARKWAPAQEEEEQR
jgi:hypothetical protein